MLLLRCSSCHHGGAIGGECAFAFDSHQSAVAMLPSSNSPSLFPQQRRFNFTGLPPRWYKTAGVEEDGEVRI